VFVACVQAVRYFCWKSQVWASSRMPGASRSEILSLHLELSEHAISENTWLCGCPFQGAAYPYQLRKRPDRIPRQYRVGGWSRPHIRRAL